MSAAADEARVRWCRAVASRLVIVHQVLLFVPEGEDRLQPGRVQGGIEPAHQTQEDGEGHRADGQPGSDQEQVEVAGLQRYW